MTKPFGPVASGLIVQHYTAGLPKLCFTGLSENWLLKECGDRHWSALARERGLDVPDFRDADGRALYAAFTALRVTEARLEDVDENEHLALASRSIPVGRARHYGVHELWSSRGELLAKVEMSSVFVRRDVPGDNHSIVRVRLPSTAAVASAEAVQAADDLLETSRAYRKGTWIERFGLRSSERRAVREFDYQPCPYADFNGVRLLYFASFQSIVDRAEWAWFGRESPATVAERDITFYGNLNLGEAVKVVSCAERFGADEFAHWCEIRRTRDDVRIADVFTRKRRWPSSGR